MNMFMSGVDGAGHRGTPARVSAPVAAPLHRFLAVLIALTMVIGGLALTMPVAGADAGTRSATTADLNLRAAPALDAEILDVIPSGAAVEVLGAPENGFSPVAFDGQQGYAYGAYITGVSIDGGPVTTGGEQGEVNVADGPVNFRSGPSLDDAVISIIPDGGLVALTGDSANGFVSIIYTDRSGWADAGLVFGDGDQAPAAPETDAPAEDPAGPESVPVGDVATGTATVDGGRLNIRSGPGLDYAVVTVISDGAVLELRGDGQNGFHPISYDGNTGWVAADLLVLEGAAPEAPATEAPATEAPAEVPATEIPTEAPEAEAPATEVPTEAPAAPPVDGSDGYTEDEIIQIIYAAADQYGQPREDMLRVARCESVLDPTAVNASSNASGLFQFLPSTWATTPYADQDIFDPVANAEAAAWMWENGRRGEWTCQ